MTARYVLRLRLDEVVGAFMLLTRLPVGAFSCRAVPPGQGAWAWPLVGVAIGVIGSVVFWGTSAAGLPPALAAIWSVAATVLATGGLHEDGLADTADGLGGGRTRERKLDIMRDSRIGGFGALALILSVTTRATAFAVLASPWAVAGASICAAVAGRAAMLGLLLALKPARPDGLAAPLGDTPKPRAMAGLALAALVVGLPGGFAALAAAATAALAIGWIARRQIGGYTGDVLGAAEQLAECVALTACLSRFG
jgi:adenosylcobinamide-GDP ribazoletransferase